MIPDLSIEEASFLREVIKLNRRGDTTDIEELDLLVAGGLQDVQQKYPTTASRFRTLMGMKRGEIGWSPVLESAKTMSPQVRFH
jgi:CobQ-like glutamine amidotransferase family enzyme